MKKELIEKVQKAIVLYVTKKEGKKRYKGNNQYNLEYIKNSAYIPKRRKCDIQALDQMINKSVAENRSEDQLFLEIYRYLKTIKTGFLLFWVIPVGTSSWMRNQIHDQLFIHNTDLFNACENGTVDAYKPKKCEDNENQNLLDSKDQNDSSISDTYVQIKKKNSALELENQRLMQENRMLGTKYSNALLVNSKLREKLDQKSIKKCEEGVEMIATSGKLYSLK